MLTDEKEWESLLTKRESCEQETGYSRVYESNNACREAWLKHRP
jgi:hypothetical protein